MNWIGLAYSLEVPVLLVYAVYVLWSVADWVLTRRGRNTGLRDWLGAFAMIFGACSAAMFACFVVYFWTHHRFIASGSALAIYLFTGEALALLGMALGLFGRGWARQRSTTISLVMMFWWYGRMIVGVKNEAITIIVMLISISIWIGVLVWVSRLKKTPAGGPVMK